MVFSSVTPLALSRFGFEFLENRSINLIFINGQGELDYGLIYEIRDTRVSAVRIIAFISIICRGVSVTKVWGRDEGKNTKSPPLVV